jgi:hypothetical protein
MEGYLVFVTDQEKEKSVPVTPICLPTQQKVAWLALSVLFRVNQLKS